MSAETGQVHISQVPTDRALTSEWVSLSQDMIDGFAEATLDDDPMHVDPEWARTGPFGTTIAFGFLTMSLLTHLLHSALSSSPVRDLSDGYYLNYGFDRMRLVSPVPVDSRVRGVFRMTGQTPDEKGRQMAVWDSRVEVEGAERPALVGRWLTVWVPPSSAEAAG